MTFLYKTYPVDYDYICKSGSPTILFLHGWGGDKNSFSQAKKFFSFQYSILSISLPPYGDSCVPLTMQDYCNIAFNILNLLNISNVIIVCHSFGMRVALMLTVTQIHIDKIIITGGAGIIFKKNFIKKLSFQHNLILMKKHPKLSYKFSSPDYKNLSYIDKQTFKNIVNKNLANYIKNLNCPIMLFWGKKDKDTPIKIIKIFKKYHQNLHIKIFANGTHFCYLEYAQNFIDECQNFLNM